MSPDHVVIHPGTVQGEVSIPSSKSQTHRAFLLAAQSTTPCTVTAPLFSADTGATLRCLLALGARAEIRRDAVSFTPSIQAPPHGLLDCGNSGTTLRLLSGTAARLPFPVAFTGDDSLCTRPNQPLLDALATLGARIEGGRNGHAPFQVTGPLAPGTVRLPPGTSSQFASSLLLSLPLVHGASTLQMAAPVASGPYLDLTVETATRFGLTIGDDTDPDGRTFSIPGGQAPQAANFAVEGDWSTAAFPLVAAAITEGDVTIFGMRPESKQGDRAILAHLRSFGANVSEAPAQIRVEGSPLHSPGQVDVSATPDLFPILAVLATYAKGTTTFVGGAALRHKESDRIQAMTDGLAKMGANVRERPDGLEVEGGTMLQGAKVASRGDHRIHMALAIAALGASGTTVIDDPACVAVSYPAFHEHLGQLVGVEA